MTGDDLGEGSLSGPGRPEKDERLNSIRFDGAAQELSGSEEMRLAGILLEIPRAHPCGERLMTADFRLWLFGLAASCGE
jgi:hypothetical protein